MPNPLNRRIGLACACLLAFGVSACDQPEDTTAPEFGNLPSQAMGVEAFDVYTQNVYLGGNTGPLFSLDFSDLSDPVKLGAIITAVNVFWLEVQNSGVPERISAIVDEIGGRMPHMVGLQEVLQFVVLDAGTPVAVVDMLALLEAEIQARGLPYVTEVVQPTIQSGLPMGIDPSVGNPPFNPVLAFTDREVILRRTDVPLVPGDDATDSGQYDAFVSFGPVEARRGWVRATVEHGGVPYSVVSTHLEVQALPLRPIHDAQAAQLINGVLSGLEGVTVLVGDLNSDAAAGPGAPSWTPTYETLLDEGFSDVWDLSSGSRTGTGFTCCQDPSLRNGASELDQRIDFVLVRHSGHLGADRSRMPGAFWSEVVGDELADLTNPMSLWPADHAGIMASLRLPRGLVQ